MARKKKRKTTRKKSFFGPAAGFLKSAFALGFKALPGFAVLAVFAGALFGIRQSLYADPHLSIREVQVEPASGLTPGRRQDLETRLLGKNILGIDLKQIALDLQQNPQIRSARVNRDLPSRVKVYITNRTPTAFVHFSANGPYGVVSEDGMILDVAQKSNSSLVTIEAYGLGIKSPVVGQRINHRGYSETVDFLKAFWRHPIAKRETLGRISIDPQGQVIVVLGAGPEIRLGRRPASRMATLEKVMHLLEGDGRAMIEYIDLQYDNVIVKRKQ